MIVRVTLQEVNVDGAPIGRPQEQHVTVDERDRDFISQSGALRVPENTIRHATGELWDWLLEDRRNG